MIIALAIFATASTYGQDLKNTEVPATFTAGLLETYPNATDIEWQRDGTDYKVDFKVGELEHEIQFNKDGDKVSQEKEITKIALPQALAKAIKRDYADYKIDKAYSTFTNGVTTYKVELVKDLSKTILATYSVSGKALGTSGN